MQIKYFFDIPGGWGIELDRNEVAELRPATNSSVLPSLPSIDPIALVCIVPEGFEWSLERWQLVLAEWDRRQKETGSAEPLTEAEVVNLCFENIEWNCAAKCQPAIGVECFCRDQNGTISRASVAIFEGKKCWQFEGFVIHGVTEWLMATQGASGSSDVNVNAGNPTVT